MSLIIFGILPASAALMLAGNQVLRGVGVVGLLGCCVLFL